MTEERAALFDWMMRFSEALYNATPLEWGVGIVLYGVAGGLIGIWYYRRKYKRKQANQPR